MPFRKPIELKKLFELQSIVFCNYLNVKRSTLGHLLEESSSTLFSFDMRVSRNHVANDISFA